MRTIKAKSLNLNFMMLCIMIIIYILINKLIIINMAELRQIFKCEVCGNIVNILHAGAGQLVCCGVPMNQLESKKEDEGYEKHVPVIIQKGDRLSVRVGETDHPMSEKHHIEWIEVINGNDSQLKFLKNNGKPVAEFEGVINEAIVRCYCNIHGLWESSNVLISENNSIKFEDFAKIDLRVAEISDASLVEGSEKLVRLKVLIGEEVRQIVAGIRQYYLPETLIGKKVVIVANLEPKKMFGEESIGMVLAAKDDSGELSLLVLEKDLASGIKIS